MAAQHLSSLRRKTRCTFPTLIECLSNVSYDQAKDLRFAIRDETLHLVDVNLAFWSIGILVGPIHVDINDVSGNGLKYQIMLVKQAVRINSES